MLIKRLSKVQKYKQVHDWFGTLVSIKDEEISIPCLAKRLNRKRHGVYKAIIEFCPIVRYRNENGTLVAVVSGEDLRMLGTMYQDGCLWRERPAENGAADDKVSA